MSERCDFREELILVAMKAGQMPRKWATRTVDAMLAHRQTVECPECGGLGFLYGETCPGGCIDGRVPGETRLAIVERQVGWYDAEDGDLLPSASYDGPRSDDWTCAYERPVFLLAPDLPDDRPEWERRLTSGEYDDAAPDLPEGTNRG